MIARDCFSNGEDGQKGVFRPWLLTRISKRI